MAVLYALKGFNTIVPSGRKTKLRKFSEYASLFILLYPKNKKRELDLNALK